MKFVDTDVLIDFYRKYQPAIDFLDYYYSRNEILAISPITQMELYVGCRNKRELTETVKFLEQYKVVHFSSSISRKTVELIRLLPSLCQRGSCFRKMQRILCS